MGFVLQGLNKRPADASGAAFTRENSVVYGISYVDSRSFLNLFFMVPIHPAFQVAFEPLPRVKHAIDNNNNNNNNNKKIMMMMMMVVVMMMMIIIKITISFKGAIRDIDNLLTAPRTVSNTYSPVAWAQLCANLCFSVFRIQWTYIQVSMYLVLLTLHDS